MAQPLHAVAICTQKADCTAPSPPPECRTSHLILYRCTHLSRWHSTARYRTVALHVDRPVFVRAMDLALVVATSYWRNNSDSCVGTSGSGSSIRVTNSDSLKSSLALVALSLSLDLSRKFANSCSSRRRPTTCVTARILVSTYQPRTRAHCKWNARLPFSTDTCAI